MTAVHVQYFAILREQARRAEESLDTRADTAAELYEELKAQHGFRLARDQLRVAVNGAFVPWDHELIPGDRVVFIPPVAGG
jgi:molybdopterin converting factor subunit 1